VTGLRGRAAVALVARREITQRVREKSFLVSMGVTALLHASGQEGGPLELEVTGTLTRQLARLLLARGRAVHPDQHLLRDEEAIAQDLPL
jgi:hypothetical protein